MQSPQGANFNSRTRTRSIHTACAPCTATPLFRCPGLRIHVLWASLNRPRHHRATSEPRMPLLLPSLPMRMLLCMLPIAPAAARCRRSTSRAPCSDALGCSRCRRFERTYSGTASFSPAKVSEGGESAVRGHVSRGGHGWVARAARDKARASPTIMSAGCLRAAALQNPAGHARRTCTTRIVQPPKKLVSGCCGGVHQIVSRPFQVL